MLVLYNPPSSARRKPVMPLSLLALGALLEPWPGAYVQAMGDYTESKKSKRCAVAVGADFGLTTAPCLAF